jgi:hypothetical protein
VLSNINRSQIEREAPELSRLFPPGTTITRDELTTWDALEPEALLARLKACFDPWVAIPEADVGADRHRRQHHPSGGSNRDPLRAGALADPARQSGERGALRGGGPMPPSWRCSTG